MRKILKYQAFRRCERSEASYEMARDEARHGKALKGLLDRYFK